MQIILSQIHKQMTTVEIRQKLHDYIADADDNKVTGMYLLLEEEINQSGGFQLTPQHIVILEEEKKKHLERRSASYAWEAVKAFVRRSKSGN